MKGDKPGEILFILAQRQDRMKEHLTKKIERLDKRIAVLEERGRE
jgi:chaperonin cofactor prefoldin